MTLKNEHQGQHENCFGCKIKTVQISPAATPTRTGMYKHPARTPNPSWERGIPTDERGMPFLQPGTTEPMYQKEFSEKRHLVEEARRQHKQAAAPASE